MSSLRYFPVMYLGSGVNRRFKVLDIKTLKLVDAKLSKDDKLLLSKADETGNREIDMSYYRICTCNIKDKKKKINTVARCIALTGDSAGLQVYDKSSINVIIGQDIEKEKLLVFVSMNVYGAAVWVDANTVENDDDTLYNKKDHHMIVENNISIEESIEWFKNSNSRYKLYIGDKLEGFNLWKTLSDSYKLLYTPDENTSGEQEKEQEKVDQESSNTGKECVEQESSNIGVEIIEKLFKQFKSDITQELKEELHNVKDEIKENSNRNFNSNIEIDSKSQEYLKDDIEKVIIKSITDRLVPISKKLDSISNAKSESKVNTRHITKLVNADVEVLSNPIDDNNTFDNDVESILYELLLRKMKQFNTLNLPNSIYRKLSIKTLCIMESVDGKEAFELIRFKHDSNLGILVFSKVENEYDEDSDIVVTVLDEYGAQLNADITYKEYMKKMIEWKRKMAYN